MAIKTESGMPTFALPDGEPIAPAVVEADLQARVRQCEAALEDSVWQLARFYSFVGRHEEATACVTRLMEAWTEDPGKQAAGYLALGQLLEQREQYAEAEAAYARGLAVEPLEGEVAYFLHNNRGYCLNMLGRHAEAERLCRSAIGIDPHRHNAHKNLGLALAAQGQFAHAGHALLEADQRCPADSRARRHLADLLTAHPEILLQDEGLAVECASRGLVGGLARTGSA
jgi:Flp pilus assembly protein TadD